MLEDKDFDFHHRPDSHWQHVDTLYSTFSIPEANIDGGVYVLTRPVLGVCMSDISIRDRISQVWEESAYLDNQQHLPCPKSLLKYTLPNGVSVEAKDSFRHYQISYQPGIDDTSLTLDYVCLHDPYVMGDPEKDPVAAKRGGMSEEGATFWGGGGAGHYDATYHVTGELILRGKRYDVDSVETCDRSWGVRPERESGLVHWWHVSFGKRLTCHIFARHDLANEPKWGALLSGYILEDGATYGLVEARGISEWWKALPMGGEVEVIDTRGKRFRFSYSTMAGNYWAPYPSATYVHSMIRANHNGEIGYGVHELSLNRHYLTRHRDAILS
jgi:hypothetical protein